MLNYVSGMPCFCTCSRWSEEWPLLDAERAGQTEQVEFQKGSEGGDKSEMARKGQGVSKLRNGVVTRNVPDEGHSGFLFW